MIVVCIMLYKNAMSMLVEKKKTEGVKPNAKNENVKSKKNA